MSRSSEVLPPEVIEGIVRDLLFRLPGGLSLSDSRNLVCELLFGLGLEPDDLPLFLLMVVDAYMGHRHVDMARPK